LLLKNKVDQSSFIPFAIFWQYIFEKLSTFSFPVQLQCRDGESSAAAGLCKYLVIVWPTFALLILFLGYKTPEEIVRSLFHDPIGAHDLTTLVT
jgi:hypothetical protein